MHSTACRDFHSFLLCKRCLSKTARKGAFSTAVFVVLLTSVLLHAIKILLSVEQKLQRVSRVHGLIFFFYTK